MKRPIPLEALIISILKTRKEIWYNDLVQALKAYYPDVTESEILKSLMKLELAKLIVVERTVKKDNPYYIRLLT